MNRKELIEAIQNNLRQADVRGDDVRVQPDPVRGWRIAVISPDFDRFSMAERSALCTKGLAEEQCAWLDLLTPEEVAWAGPLPAAGAERYLPLWPEMLAKSERAIDPIPFPTDEDEDLSPPIVVTFYSLRGGVGRSTAMAYTAKWLASGGRKVVCVDMDLEAPGLAALFGIREESVRLREDGQTARGVVQLLVELDQGGDPDFAQHLIPVEKHAGLYLLPAGIADAEYARKLRHITPDFWYGEENNPLLLFMKKLCTGLSFTPDVILLDSRTGLSEVSGPLLFGLSDMAIITFFPHPQAESGTRLLTQGILRAVVQRSERLGIHAPIPRFLVSPIPASTLPEVKRRYRDRPLEWIADWLEEVQELRRRQGLEELQEEEITHFIEYREDLATSDKVLDFDNALSPYGKLSEWIERLLPQGDENRAGQEMRGKKEAILDAVHVATGIAESQENLLDHLIVHDAIKRALRSTVVLVIGRKGTGKTALFRFLRESAASRDRMVVVHAPHGLKDNPPWMMTYDAFGEVERILSDAGAQWRHFWAYYCAVALYHAREEDWSHETRMVGLDEASQSPSAFLGSFQQFLKKERFGITLSDTLKRMDAQLVSRPLTLLLDGLDTGFGTAPAELHRRKSATTELFSFWMESQSLSNVTFKIFLREDIWRGLVFQNKSHLFGRIEELKWNDPTNFLKVIIRQVMDCRLFKEFLLSIPGLSHCKEFPVDQWNAQEVRAAWNLLVGERMQGGNAAFTRNWVWKRLADANGDHTPRFLLQLFYHAIAWERDKQKRTPWEKTIIRPRGLIECLAKVSGDAVNNSLREEFQELDGLLGVLKGIGYSPVQKEDLQDHAQWIDLAREIGLLEVYQADAEGMPVRYRVPDIYRLALNMTRKGQA